MFVLWGFCREQGAVKSDAAGYDFNQGVDHDKLLDSFLTTGFQATNFGKAVEEVRRMVSEEAWCVCVFS